MEQDIASSRHARLRVTNYSESTMHHGYRFDEIASCYCNSITIRSSPHFLLLRTQRALEIKPYRVEKRLLTIFNARSISLFCLKNKFSCLKTHSICSRLRTVSWKRLRAVKRHEPTTEQQLRNRLLVTILSKMIMMEVWLIFFRLMSLVYTSYKYVNAHLQANIIV